MTLRLTDVHISAQREGRRRKRRREEVTLTLMDAPCHISQVQQEERCTPEESPVDVLEKTDDVETLLR